MICPQSPAEGPLCGGDARPAAIWAALATESQERVIRLLAQLACTLATTPVAHTKEAAHAARSRPAKLRPDHLARPAWIYVRQSTLA